MPTEQITRHDTAGGVRIYSIPVRVFANLVANIYLVIAGDYVALIDTGSGLGESDQQLQRGIEALRTEWGESLGWSDITRIVITHGHIDHFGGLGFVRQQTDAPIAVHELDRRILTNYEERRILANRALADYLRRAGVGAQRRAELMQMYGWSKGAFHSVEVATVLRDGDLLDGLMRVYHVPGHCPGQVCLQLGDVLFSADHLLARTALFLSPESITPATGVDHYLQSLRRIAEVREVRLALGGHEEPIDDFHACIARTEAAQQQRIDRVYATCAEPRTIAEMTEVIYPELSGYDTLLALQKIGAYVEYLDQRGLLAIDNLDQVARDEQAAPRYRQA